MGKSTPTKKIDLAAPSAPLAADPFAALAGLDTSALPAGHDAPASAPAPGKPAKKACIVLRREKKDRGGKTVVVASGFPSRAEAGDVLRALRKALGCGGAVEEEGATHALVLQGDRPAAVAGALREWGYPVGGVIA